MDLKRYAVVLELDATEFNACLDEGKFAALVQEDVDEGVSHGVSSTPTVFINGRPIAGAVPIETFDRVIREELVATEPVQ